MSNQGFLNFRFLLSSISLEDSVKVAIDAKVIDRKNLLDTVVNVLSLSWEAIEKSHYNISLRYSQRGADLSTLVETPASSRLLLRCLEIQAYSEWALQNETRAIELFKKVVSLGSLIFADVHHLCLSRSVDALARLYRTFSMYTLAVHYGAYLIDIYRYNSLSVSKEVAQAFSHMSAIHQSQGRLNSALGLMQEAYRVYLQLYGTLHANSARCLHSIGILKEALGDYGSSTEQCYLRALDTCYRLSVLSHRGHAPLTNTLPCACVCVCASACAWGSQTRSHAVSLPSTGECCAYVSLTSLYRMRRIHDHRRGNTLAG